MEYKYSIRRDADSKTLIIEEYALVDNADFLSLLYSSAYDEEVVEQAVENGINEVIKTLINKDFFPVRVCAERIADAIIKIYETADEQPVEVLFDDKELLPRIEEEFEEETELPISVVDDVDSVDEATSPNLEELLEDDIDIEIVGDEPVEPIINEDYEK